jgi:D-serine deaminase-like pyridoxal phosphate-dependent protein
MRPAFLRRAPSRAGQEPGGAILNRAPSFETRAQPQWVPCAIIWAVESGHDTRLSQDGLPAGSQWSSRGDLIRWLWRWKLPAHVVKDRKSKRSEMSTARAISPSELELPSVPVATPCWVIFEDRVRHNLSATVKACGGVHRLMPHVKTHRAPWIVEWLLAQGVQAFKCATPAEVELALGAGAKHVIWAYPSANPVAIDRFVKAARSHADAQLTGLLDSDRGLALWKDALDAATPSVRLRVDLDPGMGRTGVAMSEAALRLARAAHHWGRFAGWHVYDGHIHGERAVRQREVAALAERLATLQSSLRPEGIAGDVIAGGSYTFDLWPREMVRYVSPGSWTYSSAQHDSELAELDWQPAAFVLATVLSTHRGTATLDAGSKAISPDKPVAERFRWDGRIVLMSEEHTVVESADLSVGDRIYLLPRHACTTAYLYDAALVKTIEGRWEYRRQLGSAR